MDLDVYYKQGVDCIVEDMDGDLLVFNPNNVVTLHLNGSSSFIWELCTGENSIADIVEVLEKMYPSQASQMASDVVHTVANFLQNGLLDKVEPTE